MLKTDYHARRRAERMQDPDFRAEYERTPRGAGGPLRPPPKAAGPRPEGPLDRGRLRVAATGPADRTLGGHLLPNRGRRRASGRVPGRVAPQGSGTASVRCRE